MLLNVMPYTLVEIFKIFLKIFQNIFSQFLCSKILSLFKKKKNPTMIDEFIYIILFAFKLAGK